MLLNNIAYLCVCVCVSVFLFDVAISYISMYTSVYLFIGR